MSYYVSVTSWGWFAATSGHCADKVDPGTQVRSLGGAVEITACHGEMLVRCWWDAGEMLVSFGQALPTSAFQARACSAASCSWNPGVFLGVARHRCAKWYDKNILEIQRHRKEVITHIINCESTVGGNPVAIQWCPQSSVDHVPAIFSPAARGSSNPTLPHGRKRRIAYAAWRLRNPIRTRSLSRAYTSTNIGSQPIHRLSAVRSALGVRWSHGNLQPLRHPGPPALLQVIGLGVNGGGLTTRRCRRRTSRAATTQASPSERM